mgnify:FL=1
MLLKLNEKPIDSIAVIDSNNDNLTYGELVDFSNTIKQHITQRTLIFVLAENNVGGIAWTISSIAAGIVPLILNAHTDKELLDTLLSTYNPQYVCAPTQFEGESIVSLYGYTLYKLHDNVVGLNSELSHLLPTSGSTGSPKLVRHKYDNIEAAALNISTFFELDEKVRPLLVLPLYYTMGLSVVFSHLYVGATILITGLSMTDPKFWTFLKDQRATSFTGVPYSFEILNLMRFFRMDLPDLELLTQGGGKMSAKLNQKFAEFCRDNGKRWIATYGQSEGTARMAYLPAELAVDKCGSIGRAVPNGELFLIDEQGNTITTTNTEGEMCYRGKNVTMGYAYNQQDLLLSDENNGLLHTGDLAYRDEDGCYFIVGRKGRFLKLFGMRIGLDECEQIVKSKYSLECACVGNDDKMIVYIVDEKYKQLVKDELVEKTKIVASAFEVRVINEIPKNQTGKILYSKLEN